MRNSSRGSFVLLAALMALPLAAQTVPSTINYQGRLTDNTPSQSPVNFTTNMQFEIWDVASGGAVGTNRLWREPSLDNAAVLVPVSNGIFSYALGTTVPIPPAIFTGATSARYLQIIINPGASQEILAPRQLITATGYAGLAENAGSALSAGTVTHGVYTTGSYADPAWLASLGGGKITGTVPDSNQLGGIAAANWQKSLTTAGCPANQFYNAIAQDGTATCGVAPVTEIDPKVGTLTTGRVPYWNATSLANGTMFDAGGRIGINTVSPITPLQVGAGNPVFAGSSTSGLTSPTSVYVQGRYAFVVNYSISGALVIFDITNPASPVTIGSSTAGLNQPRTVYVQGRYAFVASAGNNSLVIFDISNPASPVNVGSSNTGLASPQFVYVQGRYAYVASSGNNTLVVFDVGNPASPVNVGASAAGLNFPNTVQVQGRYAYVASLGNNSLAIFDIANPAGPVNVGSSATGLNQPYAATVQGRYAYVASAANNSLVVFDVANPAGPVKVGASITGLNQPRYVHVQGTYAFVTSAANNSLVVFDVSDPASPFRVGSTATGLTVPLDFHLQGRYAYVASANNLSLVTFDLGGAYLQQLEAGSLETGALAVRGNAQIGGDLDVKGGLSVGNGGINSAGSVSGGSLATPGAISLGVRLVACPISTPIQDCSCAAGESVVSGGGYIVGAGNRLRESGPLGATGWRVSCSNSSGTDINCAGMNILCDRRAS